MKKITIIEIACVMALMGILAYAQLSAKLGVSLTIPPAQNILVTTSKIIYNGNASALEPDGYADLWLTPQSGNTSLDFGELYFDAANAIYRAGPRFANNGTDPSQPGGTYYAVEVSADGAGPWEIVHNVSEDLIVATTGNNSSCLGDNIGATFVKQVNATAAEALADVQGGKWTVSDAAGKRIHSDLLGGGWLRIYYGVYGGVANNDPLDPGYIPGANVVTVAESNSSLTVDSGITLTLDVL